MLRLRKTVGDLSAGTPVRIVADLATRQKPDDEVEVQTVSAIPVVQSRSWFDKDDKQRHSHHVSGMKHRRFWVRRGDLVATRS